MNKQTLLKMRAPAIASIESTFSDDESPKWELRSEMIAGLTGSRKSLPCKFFYDERGSQLFDAICNLPEYYPTRTELAILREHADSIASVVGPRAILVEYGSGSSTKTRVLLDSLLDPAGYVPIDISRDYLQISAQAIAVRYPHVQVQPVCVDYTRPFCLPSFDEDLPSRRVAFFPGSTIGNFEPAEALAFLKTIRATCGAGGGLLIGVDLKKDPAILHAAYNDVAGVTAAFNRNILHHINLKLGLDFDIKAFAHYAFYNPQAGRMEMHLISQRAQRVDLGRGDTAYFEEGESIHTENCYKYTLDEFEALAAMAGFTAESIWTDANHLFSVQYFSSAD